VLVVFDPTKVSYEQLLRVFWEHHDPTQGMRQGNDVGTQYRSTTHTFSEVQRKSAETSRDAYYAEDHHQQYLSDSKNPNGYCPDHGTGVSCPVGLTSSG
jgi:peptide-methionine (S)-S-oxide reductase